MKNRLRMHARVVLGFSDDLEKARGSLKEAIEEANKTILLKGAPRGHEDEGAKITSWEVKGRFMDLEIDSGTLVRATSAALRIKRHLGNMLGREHRIGVRELRAETIELTIPVEDQIGREATSRIKAIPSVSEVEYHAGEIKVKISQMGEHDLKNNVPDRILNRVRSVQVGSSHVV
ncbi:hypothetical protein KEJ39_06780, partial [Candidatus Bathyarchaeota archaeon]|nr:hypothetical protein [Candidatus Bathyarchaeota archaeon]